MHDKDPTHESSLQEDANAIPAWRNLKSFAAQLFEMGVVQLANFAL
jgi:hypothetical protein